MQKTLAPPSFIAPGHTLTDELIIRGIKLVDIGYISAIYFLSAFVISKFLDNLYGTFDPKAAALKPKYIIIIEIILQFALLGILTYFARNIMEQIPFPLNGIHGYNHLRLKELSSASLFSVILVLYQNNLHAKLSYIASSPGNFFTAAASAGSS